MHKLKITKVGSSSGVVLPKELLAQMNVERGDSLYVTRTPDGFKLTPFNPEFEEQMALARSFMAEHRDALRELAK